jgi:glycine/D-amino acid oxidase-like deaminating enzyme
MRLGYGADEIYTRMAMRSLELWKELQAQTGERLFHETGVLRLSHHDDAYSVASQATLERVRAQFEVFDPDETARRWPQMRQTVKGTYALWEPESGVLMARRAVAAASRDAVAKGAEFAIREVAWPDARVDAETLVFACGPWLPKLFPGVVGRRIEVTRQEIFYFAPPAGSSEFAPPRFPAWVDFTDARGPYGVPDIESRGFKVGLDLHGEAFDPDTGSREISAEGLARTREFVAERFPALADAPLAETRVCQYANTSSGDFLLDRHPGERNVWLVGGGSGHGFKHGPAVGEYVAGQILGTGEAEPRFGWATKGEAAERKVW